MTSTANTAAPAGSVSYLQYLQTLSHEELQAEKVKNESEFSERATTIDGATIQRLLPSDASLFADQGEINYESQQRNREADESARQAVSEGAGKTSEACAKL
jgi:hypothetical protein